MCEPPARRVDFTISVGEGMVLANAFGLASDPMHQMMVMVTQGPGGLMGINRALDLSNVVMEAMVEQGMMAPPDGRDVSPVEDLDDAEARFDVELATFEGLCPGDLAALGGVVTQLAIHLHDPSVELSEGHEGRLWMDPDVVERFVDRLMAATLYADQDMWDPEGPFAESVGPEDFAQGVQQRAKVAETLSSKEHFDQINGERVVDSSTGEPAYANVEGREAPTTIDTHFLSELPPVELLDLDTTDEGERGWR
jgi:hypothetical protein